MKLDDIEKLTAAASPGPWPAEFGRCDFPDDGSMACGPIITLDEDGLTDEEEECRRAQADQDFIRMSRELMPKLLKVAKASKYVRDIGDYANDRDWVALDVALAELEQP